MLYDYINVLPFDAHGWFGGGHASKLTELINERGAKNVIEVGSWLGKSTRFIAKLLPDDGKIFAVDTWEGSYEHHKGQQRDRLPTLFHQFLSNVIHENLQNKIVPLKLASLDAAKVLNIKADLIYIDAAHDEKAVYEDIIAWYPHLQENGAFCGDDYDGHYSGLIKSVHRFAEENSLSVNTHGRFWWYTKK